MKKPSYSDKLKDPRWQKKRLQILERDKWGCIRCGDTESTLHVHHKVYKNEVGERCEPWDVPDKYLVTLCEECHNDESIFLQENLDILCEAAKEQFISPQVHQLAIAIHNMPMVYSEEIVASAIEYWFSRDFLMKELVDRYFDYLEKRAKNKTKSKK